ncbi:uncharacterized protein LOC130629038 isoform X2 [Hydractinia symbiolongicarpus]|uniref:uncharacterized protein LOC130629038 isoform X2 n=1 Tax=Hydractinia symbiolongicarpus TaxID=13093 RepID=UPI00254D19EC|nr:uncharacterized protein LOC130629038 isoform X2 [Hydractinia symbiolongicarpus]
MGDETFAQACNFSTLKRLFNDDQSKAYMVKGQPLLNDQGLESEAKKVYRTFLTTSSFAQVNRLDSYFSEWTLATSLTRPFDTIEQKNAAFKALERSEKFHAQLVFESMITNRDDADDVQTAMKSVLFSSAAVKVNMYFTGDDDIIQGLAIVSQYKDGSLYFVTLISD